MNFDFNRGFSVYKGDRNLDLAFVAIHAGPAIQNPVHRDDHSDTVASLCWQQMGGKLIVSNVSRNRYWGIDFNRDIPPLKKALEMYEEFNMPEKQEKLHKYTKKYGWVAKDEYDYYSRLRIYQNFWAEVNKSKYVVLIHKNFPKMKAVPSIIDIVTFSQKGVKNKIIKKVVEDANAKYFDFFEKISADYKDAILSDTRRFVLNVLRIHDHFNPNDMGSSFKEGFEKDLKKITKYADKIALNRLKVNFNPYNYLEAVKNSLKFVPPPCVTVESVHDGSLALGPVNKLFPNKDKVIIEVESSGFINFWHPNMAAKIICDVIGDIVQ